jgi:DNA-binding MarR family transcriptional regulator
MIELSPQEQLSNLQQKILKHIVECTHKNESVSHISRELNTLQPAVFRSVKSLIEEGYVKKEGDYTGRKKLLSLTEKGAAVSLLLADKNQDYLEKFNEVLKEKLNESNLPSPLQQVIYLLKEEPSNREAIANKAIEYWLKNNLFQKDKIDRNKWTYFFLNLVSESDGALRQLESVKKLIEKYGLDKSLIIKTLEEKKRAIDLLIDELELDQTKQAARAVKR